MAKKTMSSRGTMYPIFCPYCMRSYWANNVVFRKDPEKQNSSAEYQHDPYLEAYNNRYRKRENTFLTRTIDPACLPEMAKKYSEENGMLVGVRDVEGNNWTATQRICPYCHNKIVRMAGLHRTHVLSVVGFKGSGKTTYEASLLGVMADRNKCGVMNVSECEDPLSLDNDLRDMKDGKPINSTVEAGGPFHYQITFQKNQTAGGAQNGAENFLLSMVDLPGERFGDPNALGLDGRAIPRSDTCVFLVDLDNMENSARVFGTLISHYHEELKVGRVNVAVVLNKADRLNAYFPKIPANMPFRHSCSYAGCVPLSMERINNNHDAIVLYVVNYRDERGNVSHLSSLHTALTENIAPGHFKWFAAYSMENGVYKPNNVEEPLLWSLAMKGMYPSNP